LIDTGRQESMASWSGSTRKLVWVSNRNGPFEIWLRDADGTERPVVTAADFPPSTNKAFLAPAISPDGERIIYQRVDSSGISRLWITSLSGGSPVRLTNLDIGELSGSWSPDSSRFVYVEVKDGKSLLMMVKASGNATPETLRDLGDQVELPDWSPMGNWITCLDDKGWNLISPDGKTSKFLGKIPVDFLAFSRDGKLLYGMRMGESRPAPDSGRGILFSLDPVTLKEKVIKDLGRSLAPDSNFGPGNRLSLGPDEHSFVYTINESRVDWWIFQDLPQPGWRERLRSLFDKNSTPEASSAPGANRP
jgi:eukaryotic-like serine/threonine-protein kinase